MEDLSFVSMIARSGWLTRSILLLLGVLSVVTWSIILSRLFYFRSVGAANQRFTKIFNGLKAVTELESPDRSLKTSHMQLLGVVVAREYRRIMDDSRSHSGVKDWSFFLENQFSIARERIDASFSAISRRLDHGIIMLAIASSASPFLGLFGTVWGIMNSFFEIGRQGNASLPVVAPGIAEALIVTAAGLAVAIPAVIFYNFFNHTAERLENDLDEFKAQATSRMKREIINVLYGDGATGK